MKNILLDLIRSLKTHLDLNLFLPARLGNRRVTIFLVPLAVTLFSHFIKLVLVQIGEPTPPLLLLYSAIVFSSWYGGLLGSGASLLVSILFLKAYPYPLVPYDNLDYALFVFEGLLIGIFTNKYLNSLYVKDEQHEALKEANLKLARSHLEKERIVDSISDAFIGLDKQQRIIYINNEACKLAGKPRAKLLDQPFFEIFHFRDQAEVKRKLMLSAASDSANRVETGLSEDQFLEMHLYPQYPTMTVFINDVSEQRLLDQRKDEFISLAGHELKTPLTTIKAIVEMIDMKRQNKPQTKEDYFFYRLRKQVEVVSDIVNNLLDVARIRNEKFEISRVQVNFDGFIRNIIGDLRLTYPENKIILEGDTDSNVMIDPSRIAQVINNLVKNAVKYSPQNETVKVKVEKSLMGKELKLTVTDKGPGISPKLQPELFERYFQVKEAVHYEKGLGLGLYISKKIINLHGGEIGLKSRLGKGASFYFTLPLIYEKENN